MTTVASPVFASVAELYLQAGWPAVLPVPNDTKHPPPTGYTGYEGGDTAPEQVAEWIQTGYAHHSIALRMPNGVIGIDVDHYDKVSTKATGETKVVKKRGGETLAKAIEQWGPLPPTWTSTARGEGPSRIALYRAPQGKYTTVIQPHIEIIQWFHRYAVVWPSTHSEVADGIYTWYAPDGSPATRIPSPHELPELPDSWVHGLAEGASSAVPTSANYASGEALLGALGADARPACTVMYDALDAAVKVLSDPDVGTRHDAMTQRTYRIILTGAFGHPGFGVALPGLRERWDHLTAGENREGEFDRMLLSAARKAVTARGGLHDLVDPCTTLGGPQWAGMTPMLADARPRPADDRGPVEGGDDEREDLHFELPPKLVDPSWTQVVGTEPFEPGVDLDHPLADAMLRRCFYMARRASDTRDAWLMRGAEQWSLEGNLAGRIVSECAALMPVGDPEPVGRGDPPSDAQRAFKRRLKMLTNGPAQAVAATIKRQTDGGRHPATVRLTDLDQDPEVLWAGGWPYDLRASGQTPTLAGSVDPYGPHLVAAGVAPADVPTPRWDAFLAAVWPDQEVRDWALRVLSIAFTGYPDAALPVLFGNGGTGKTSLVTLLMEVLGSYAHAADHRLLGSGEGHASIVFALMGRRLSFIDEAMREGSRNAERLKQLTGGGELTGNAMNQNPITFRPTHTLVLTSNTAPSVSDPALRRRVRIIPCDGDPAEVRARRQALSGARWAAEAPGVLARMMREAAGWLTHPDTALTAAAPLSVQFAMGELIQEQDVIGQWLTEAVEPNEHGMKASVLYAGFRGWCRDLGVRESSIPSLTAWGTALTERGLNKIQKRDANYRPLIWRTGGSFGQSIMPPAPGMGHNPSSTPVFAPPQVGPKTYNPSSAPVFADDSHPRNLGSANLTSDLQGSVEGLWGVGGGSAPQPSTPHNSTSDPLFSSSVEGVEGMKSSFTCEEEGEKQGNVRAIGKNPPPSTDDLEDPPSSQVGTRVEGVHNPPRDRPHPSTPPAGPANEDPGPISPRSVTKAEAARVAAEDKITKAEARRKIAEENRLAAIDAASGEYIGLPAVATREGHILAVTLEQAEAIVRAAVVRAGALTVDVETSGFPVGHRHHVLRTVQLGDEVAAVVFDAQDETQRAVARTLLAQAPKLHAHSAAADLVPLAHAGLIDAGSGWARMYDTVIPAKLADPQSTGSDPGLKQLAGAVLGQASTAPGADAGREALFKAGRWPIGKRKYADQLTSEPAAVGWAQVDYTRSTMVRYAASDVLDTAALARRLPVIPDAILARERLAEEMTSRVTHRGLPIDAERVAQLDAEHAGLRAEALARVQAFGVENPASGPQVAEVLTRLGAAVPVSAKGNPSVAEHVLAVIKRTDPDSPAGQLATAVLDFRHSNTVLSLFLATYRALVEQGDGRVRPTIYTLGTDTGRMSGSRPNPQQLSREGGVRSIYRADPGYVFVSADFSGVELRGAAALSQDPTMMRLIADEDDFTALIAARAVVDGVDDKEARARILAERGWTNGGALDGFHWVVARRTFGENATKSDRYVAKRACFGCVPLDTEILTQRGWLTYDQVQVGDKTPGRATDGTVRWTPVTGVHVYEDAPLMRIHGGQTWNAVTTPGHRWASTKRRDGGARGRYYEDEWITTETISVEHTVHLGGLLDAEGTLDISPDEAALIGWSITDGSVYFAPITGRTAQGVEGARRGARVHLYQAKPEGVTAIRKLVGDLGLVVGVREIPVGHKRTMPAFTWLLPAEPMRDLYGRAGLLTREGFARDQLETFVLGLSTPARLAFLDAAIKAEGHRYKHGVAISQNEGPTCDALELAGYLCGYRVTRSVNDQRGNATNYKLRLCVPRVTGQRLHREDAGRAPVWCVSTGFGTWTMRHNGQIMLTGNTFYGGGSETLAQQAGVPVHEMEQTRGSLRTIAPGYFEWVEQLKQGVRRGHTQFSSYSGRVIHFPAGTPHKAPAYAISGSCRELLVDALVRWRDTRWGDATLLPVHDELVIQVPAEDADAALAELVACMEGELYGVKIVAEASTPSPYWQDSV